MKFFGKNKENDDKRKIIPLFSHPISISFLDVDNDFVLEQCMSMNYDRFEIDNGFVSTERSILTQRCFLELRQKIEEELSFYLYEQLKFSVLHSYEHTSSWIMMHENNDFAQRHIHTNSMFSGIYYVRTPPYSGSLSFHYPPTLNTVTTPTIQPTLIEENIYNSRSYSLEPKEKMLLLFPSHTLHSVTSNLSNDRRYCIAFNYFLKGKFGSPEVNNLLKL